MRITLGRTVDDSKGFRYRSPEESQESERDEVAAKLRNQSIGDRTDYRHEIEAIPAVAEVVLENARYASISISGNVRLINCFSETMTACR